MLIPLLFMGDIVGRLFREFAVTLARDHPGVGRRLADADADDVLAHAAGTSTRSEQAASTTGPSAIFNCDHRVLRTHADDAS